MAMEGRGVANYSVEKPSFAFTTATTEFDDELTRRGTVTFEQAMVAKGASVEEAHRLKEVHNAEKKRTELEPDLQDPSEDQDDDDDYLLDDDEFLSTYREQRMSALKQEFQQRSTSNAEPQYGEPVLIDRQAWTREVNEDSEASWVVVTLSSTNLECTGCTEAAVKTLASAYPLIKFVMIPSKSAIPNWPDANLPTIFVYRNGEKQHELVRMKRNIQPFELEHSLFEFGVIEKKMLQHDRSHVTSRRRDRCDSDDISF